MKQWMFCGRRKGKVVPNHDCKPPCFAAEEERQKLATHYNQLRDEILLTLKEKGLFEPTPEEMFYAGLDHGLQEKTAFAIAAQVLPADGGMSWGD